MDTDAKAVILKNYLSPGDVLTMTSAIYSLHRTHPGKWLTAVDTSCPSIFDFNPDVIPLEEARKLDAKEIQMHYPSINICNQQPVHMLGGYVEFLSHVLGNINLPLCTNKPWLYLSEEERSWVNQVEELSGRKRKFWLINAGVKPDYDAKFYPHYQEVVDRLQGKVLFVQVGKLEHKHRPLKGVINLLDKTDDRQLIRLVHHCQGVVCGTTFLMHLAASFEKPAVILAGSREPKSWNTYSKQILLNNVGAMSCDAAKDGSCWKSRVVKIGDGSEQDNSLCERPMFTDPPSASCMALIKPSTVCDAIESYYAGGRLSF